MQIVYKSVKSVQRDIRMKYNVTLKLYLACGLGFICTIFCNKN